MIGFSVPVKNNNGRFFNFSVEAGAVLFAGSRHLTVPYQVCSNLIKALRLQGFGFMTGCAHGVDESFRHALALSDSKIQVLLPVHFVRGKKKLKTFILYSLFQTACRQKLHLQNGHYGLPVNAVCFSSFPLIRWVKVRLLLSILQFITVNLYLLYQKQNLKRVIYILSSLQVFSGLSRVSGQFRLCIN